MNDELEIFLENLNKFENNLQEGNVEAARTYLLEDVDSKKEVKTFIALMNCGITTEEQIKTLCLAVQGTQKKSLNLVRNGLNNPKALASFSHLKGSDITELNLSGNGIKAEGIKSLGEALQGTDVRTLYLNQARLDAESIAAFASFKGTKIKNLFIAGCQIFDKETIAELKSLKETPIINLVLSNNHINTPERIDALSQVIQGSHISSLSLDENYINNDSAVSLVMLLKKNPQITHLSLREPTLYLTEDVLELVQEHVQENKKRSSYEKASKGSLMGLASLSVAKNPGTFEYNDAGHIIDPAGNPRLPDELEQHLSDVRQNLDIPQPKKTWGTQVSEERAKNQENPTKGRDK